MKGRAVLVIAAAIIALSGAEHATLAIQGCADANNCAEVRVDAGSVSGSLKPGDEFEVHLVFKQGPDNGQAGGIDELAAVALSLGLPGSGSSTPITLKTCTLNDGFPADVLPNASLSNFKFVVENASCANGRTHCLCPDAGQTRDNFINLVVYGPNPLPTPGPSGIDIPTLPVGPETLVTIDLKVAADASSGTVPLHIINQVEDTSRPQFTAFLSVGDKLAVDQTCAPVTGQPPCSAAESVSQVAITNASVVVEPRMNPCTGDCDGNGEVAVNEIIVMVNIALETANISTCRAGDADGNGVISINEIIAAVNNALGSCPASTP